MSPRRCGATIEKPDGLVAVAPHAHHWDVPPLNFRYPVSKNPVGDKAKSPFKEVAPQSLFAADSTEYVKALVLKNAKGEVVKTFKYDKTTSKAVTEAARGAAEMLSNFHFMMRVELAGGW